MSNTGWVMSFRSLAYLTSEREKHMMFGFHVIMRIGNDLIASFSCMNFYGNVISVRYLSKHASKEP